MDKNETEWFHSLTERDFMKKVRIIYELHVTRWDP